MGVSHIVVKKGVYSRRMGIFWEGHISKGGGEEYILGASHRPIVVEKGVYSGKMG